MRSPVPLVVCLAVLIAGSTALAAVPTYSSIQLQARSNFGDGFNLPAGSSFNSGTPALNDDATLTFRLLVVGNTGNAGLWYGAAGLGEVVHHAPAGPLVRDPSINSAGKAAFEQADFGFSDGVLVYDPVTGMTQQEIPPGGIFGIQNFSSTTITDSDVIGFRADQGAQNAFIFDDGITQTPVAFEGGGGVGFLFVPGFDNANRFHAKVRLGGTAGSLPDEIRRYNPDGTFTVMAEDDDANALSPFTGFSNGVGCSPNTGLVAFTAQRVVGGDGVYVSNGTAITEIATESDAEVSGIDFFSPRVNDAGVVAFRAYDAAGLRVIYAGDGTTLRRVVGEHDVLRVDLGDARIDQHDSSPVFGGTVAINADGDIAFAATLTPEDDNQIEWGTGMFIAYADDAVAAPLVAAASNAHFGVAPNPFRADATVRFTLERPGHARIDLFDVAGRRVARLVDREQGAGAHGVAIDGRDLSPGVYFLRLEAGGRTEMRRIVRLR